MKCGVLESFLRILVGVQIRFFNTVRVDANFFKYGEKNLRFRKYPNAYGRGLRNWSFRVVDMHFDLNQSGRKSTQVHAMPGQTES